MVKFYDVVIEIKGCRFIGETTTSLAQARKRLRYERGIGDNRIVEIIKNGTELIESTHLDRIVKEG